MATTQRIVDAYFTSSASHWDQLYSEPGLIGTIYQHRRHVALRWVSELPLAPGARIADVGCGAGCTAVPLAAAGFEVTAIDRVPDMLRRTKQNAAKAGIDQQVRTVQADAQALEFHDGSFDLVVALGLLPWLESPSRGLAELLRIVRRGGYVLVSADNAWRLNLLIDPVENPLVTPLRRAITRHLRRRGWMRHKPGVAIHMHTPWMFDRLVEANGGQVVRKAGIGFGPFTFFRKKLVQELTAIRLHQRLQALADRGLPLLRSTGAHYLVLAQKT